MSSREYLGLKLENALDSAKSSGYAIKVKEVRSKKGIENGVPIVVRQRLIDENTIELCFSYFITDVAGEAGENEG